MFNVLLIIDDGRCRLAATMMPWNPMN